MNSQNLTPVWMQWPETRTLIDAFGPHHDKVQFVGGCVRDAVLGIEAKDLDLATSLTPETVTAQLKAHGITVIPTGLKHGTVTAVINRRHFEITTLRHDTACDGRHAKVAFTDKWEEDAARRDFTMNAMYLSFDGALTDFMGGAADAKAGRIIFIGDADQRIQEDYLRILRFFRFFAYYGKGAPDTKAMVACSYNVEGMSKLSGERIQHEMLKLLEAPNPLPTLTQMQKVGVAGVLVKDAAFELELFDQLQQSEELLATQAETETRLAVLFPADTFNALAERLKLPNVTKEIIENLYEHAEALGSISTDPAKGKKLLRRIGITPFKQAILLARATQEAYGVPAAKAMMKLADSWLPPEFPLSGQELIAAGFKEGKELGQVLKKLEIAWEESDYQLTKQDLLKAVKK